MSDSGELNRSGVYMPKFFPEPLTLSSKRDRERRDLRYVPPAPRPHHVRSVPSQTRLIHSRHNDSRELDSSFNMLMQNGTQRSGNHVTFFRQFFEIQERLGFGSFGDVYRCKNTVDGKEYAVKKSRRTYSGENDRARQLREVQRVVNVPSHSHMVELESAWEEDGHLYLQMELCAKSLNQHLEEGQPLSETEVWDVLIDMLHALNHLHKHHLVHLDVKPDNVFLTRDDPPINKLGDFGIVVSLEEKRDVNEYTEGDSRYLAPEVMQGHVSTKADVFSLGLTILEIACHVDLPKGGQLWHTLRAGGKLPEPCAEVLPESLREIMTLMITPDVTKRPEIDYLLRLPVVIKENRRRKWSMYYSLMKRKLISFARIWNTIICFIASLFVIGGGRTVNITQTNGTSTPESCMPETTMPEIFVNDSSYSDDDELKQTKTSTPVYASTPISVTTNTRTRSSARYRAGKLNRLGEVESPTSRNLLKEFEAVSD